MNPDCVHSEVEREEDEKNFMKADKTAFQKKMQIVYFRSISAVQLWNNISVRGQWWIVGNKKMCTF